MTGASRAREIAVALEQYRQHPGPKETMRVPLGGEGGVLVEVIEVPLSLPVLNAESFRIAPELAEHPHADLVSADPYSPAAQEIVTGLVRASHRSADMLKASLIAGQDQPGLVTREGRLINGNTRCVLLRDLRNAGVITRSTIRVGVLPSGISKSQELELESVLQKQAEHKDSYNLVSELMMLKKLHESAGLTDAAISKQLRLKNAQRVTELRAVLDLMERGRRLTTPTLPLTAFVKEEDQAQNWIELLRHVREADQREGRSAGDLVIRRWLIAYMVGYNSVHRLRHAYGSWVEKDVLPDLADGGDVGTTIAGTATVSTKVAPPPTVRPRGVDLLGDDVQEEQNSEHRAVGRLLDLVVEATNSGDADMSLGDEIVPAVEVRNALTASVARGLAASKRRSLAGNRLQRPVYGLTQARAGLREALEALDEVADVPDFAPHLDNVLILIDEVETLLAKVSDTVQAGSSDFND